MSETAKKLLAQAFNQIADALETGVYGQRVRVGVTVLGSEHGPEEIVRGAEMAQQQNPGIEVVLVGPEVDSKLAHIPAEDEKAQHKAMEQALESGALDACVTMHYSFPIGVSTVGRVITPGRGREMYLATTTGTSATDRVEGMVRNAIYGIATAKAAGISNPTVGILNVDQARTVERALQKLQNNGYQFRFAESVRADGGSVMRGNDLLVGAPDVMVTDTLTGNVLMKVFSAYTSGGDYETLGYGYGPGIGEGYDKIILILSRASGAPVVANAIKYGAEVAQGKLLEKTAAEFKAANAAGLPDLFKQAAAPAAKAEEEVVAPPEKVTTEEIPGIDILELEDAQKAVWKAGIYAATGMGCTGPVIMVAPEDAEKAIDALVKAGFISR
ncbi:MAG: glycine/sarcosine/betaine reductase complex component C subunit alpha [Bacillota bacterium]